MKKPISLSMATAMFDRMRDLVGLIIQGGHAAAAEELRDLNRILAEAARMVAMPPELASVVAQLKEYEVTLEAAMAVVRSTDVDGVPLLDVVAPAAPITKVVTLARGLKTQHRAKKGQQAGTRKSAQARADNAKVFLSRIEKFCAPDYVPGMGRTTLMKLANEAADSLIRAAEANQDRHKMDVLRKDRLLLTESRVRDWITAQ